MSGAPPRSLADAMAAPQAGASPTHEVPPPKPAAVLSASPLCLIFPPNQENQITRNIDITNTSSSRIAWQVLSNGPTRYAVNPNKGFLTPNETIKVDVILVSSAKHHPRHAFIVQGKPAKAEENNRKLVWAQQNDQKVPQPPVQNIRITTQKEGAGPRSRNNSTSSVSSVSTGAASPSASVDSSLSTGTVTGSSSASSMTSSESSVPASMTSPTDPKNHGEHAAMIQELTEKIKKALDEKKSKISRLVGMVNEVKQLEVELDRAGQTVNQLAQRQEMINHTHKELQTRQEQVKKELAALKKDASHAH